MPYCRSILKIYFHHFFKNVISCHKLQYLCRTIGLLSLSFLPEWYFWPLTISSKAPQVLKKIFFFLIIRHQWCLNPSETMQYICLSMTGLAHFLQCFKYVWFHQILTPSLVIQCLSLLYYFHLEKNFLFWITKSVVIRNLKCWFIFLVYVLTLLLNFSYK